MKLTRLIVIFVGLLFLNGVLAGTASATNVVDCQGQLSKMRNDLYRTQVTILAYTNQWDPTGRFAMLDDASAKLAEGKNADAVQTLTGFVAQGHPSLGIQDVIDCINSIGTPPTVT